jgi:hypothetical protein
VKFRHESPHAEQRIRELALPGWETASDREAKRRADASRAKRQAELASVDWAGLSPAELAFRWMLDRWRPDKRSDYGDWAAAVRAGGGAPRETRSAAELARVDALVRAADERELTPAELAYSHWANEKR